ncbi:hypothetical protein VC83_05158 [Pseudogymnoascus destructans]|uniref:Uncharacterized protein n=1 Tax=Pseudogymnoascus destructans TaxID=655981 RepID=A0A177A8R2_9PEZI|nr:uncharacterized protein VC83_05158 [Pseudogymnoascus destructans]OAF58549.1 hypothetical protein VC83_05158 [Pseudogymnoascus destructans]
MKLSIPTHAATTAASMGNRRAQVVHKPFPLHDAETKDLPPLVTPGPWLFCAGAGFGIVVVMARWYAGLETGGRAADFAVAVAIASSLQTNVKKWTDNLTGFMGWPYDNIPVGVVGWAARNTNLLQGSTSGIDVYTMTDQDGVPECDPRCGRFFHQDNNYVSYPGGADHHYDVSLWLTAGMDGGAGGDWGQRVGREYFLPALDNPHIWLHEFGHTMGFDDFYDWTPTGQTNFIMLAGSSHITEFDTWMMRGFWRHVANR